MHGTTRVSELSEEPHLPQKMFTTSQTGKGQNPLIK